MAKVSPLVRSFNAGEFSPLMEGRTDIDRYPSSNRSLLNYIAAPQGPAIPRSGTGLMNSVYDHDRKGLLVPFVFSETDFYMLEFSHLRVRFFTEDGILTRAPVAINVTSVSPFQFKSEFLAGAVDDEVAFSLFPDMYNLNGETARITAKSGAGADTLYTVSHTHPALPMLATAKAGLVYHVVSPYTEANLPDIFDLQSLDVVFLYHPTLPTKKLKRKDTYDWVFETVVYIDGPYLPTNETKTTLVSSVTGKATPNMTTDALPAGSTAFGSSKFAGSEYYFAFDDPSLQTFWKANTFQAAHIGYQASVGFICDGYSIAMAVDNADTSFGSKDYAPSTWEFEGSNDGVTYTLLDKQNDFVLYENNKSPFFNIPNLTSYTYYRLVVRSCTRNGELHPRIRSLIMRSTTSVTMTITASSITGINNDTGFQTTDIGRLIRIRGTDNSWRSLVITARTSTTVVTATLLGEPFPDLVPSDKWRLGAYSDTTGYPNTATFYEDRLWNGGSTAFPDLITASKTGIYDTYSPSEDDGTVLDTSGIAVRLNSRKLSRVKWMAEGKDGLLVGTGSEERVIRAMEGGGKTITPGNIKAGRATARGSKSVAVAVIDQQVLFVQRSGRTVREFAYAYESDNYKSPSMSQLASHLGVSPFARQAYAAEPYSIVWYLRENGTIVGLTYNREENVVGWHRHNISDGVVESIAVLPSSDQRHDVLWMIVRRVINGQQNRYIEKLSRFWDFDMEVEDAVFVDSSLRYIGDPTTEIYGLQHLEDRSDVYGLADGLPVGPFHVTDGMVTLDKEASNVILGIGFDSQGETSRLENGAQDGTAQGKVKRFTNISLMVWASYGGEVGVWNEDTGEVEWFDLADHWPQADASQLLETIELFTGIIGPILPDGNYAKNGSIHFRRKKSNPLPFNIVAFMPQLNTQDR